MEGRYESDCRGDEVYSATLVTREKRIETGWMMKDDFN